MVVLLNVNEIPDLFQSKTRLAIVSSLITGEKTFGEVKDCTGMTDGNLSSHITKLADEGYVLVKKDFYKNRPRTRYILTEKGHESFVAYVSLLERILSNSKP